MPTHAEQRTLPFSQEKLYDLVADVERYPEFLPWCVGARILKRDEENQVMYADLVIGFKLVREKFTSRVGLHPHDRIDVTYERGPFKYLNNHWHFVPSEDGSQTTIDFYIDFEFRSKMLQRIMGTLFNEAVRLMVSSFERRAYALYRNR